LGTFNVGDDPLGIAFYGTNVWVANGNGATVTKLLAATGAVPGTFSGGTAARGIAFDGVNIWVTNSSSNTVAKL
jgi:DNA-binding beta-propeller fold protein YncE